MTNAKSDANVNESYDRNSQLYFDLVASEMQQPSLDRAALQLFAELVGPDTETLDAGCGPGHITAFLTSNGLNISGIDIAPAMIELAKKSFPDIDFRVGQLSDLPLDNFSVGAVVSRHSVIHTEPEHLGEVFDEFARVLRPEGLLFLSFFATDDAGDHGKPFDHAVCTAYQLDVSAVSELLSSYGFEEETRLVRQPHAGERQMPHAILFARLAA